MNKLIVANWKMGMGLAESVELAKSISHLNFESELVLAPSFPYLIAVREAIAAGSIKLGAQDCASRNVSAFTGGVSAAQLKEIGCSYVIIGHSERRIFANETAQVVHDKIKHVLDKGLIPVLCIGEDIISHKSNETKEVISMQLDEIGFNIDWSRVIVAYEPIWAIGTGEIPTTAEIAEVAGLIIEKVKPMKVLYGGSVSKANAGELSQIKQIDGFLVGSASTKLEELEGILVAG